MVTIDDNFGIVKQEKETPERNSENELERREEYEPMVTVQLFLTQFESCDAVDAFFRVQERPATAPPAVRRRQLPWEDQGRLLCSNSLEALANLSLGRMFQSEIFTSTRSELLSLDSASKSLHLLPAIPRPVCGELPALDKKRTPQKRLVFFSFLSVSLMVDHRSIRTVRTNLFRRILSTALLLSLI